MKEKSFVIVKKKVEEVFSRKIFTSSDCQQLSEQIAQCTGQYLNVNTLRRCFGLVKAAYPPSRNTLNILSQYCGYSDLDDLVKQQEDQQSQNALNQELLVYMVSLYKNIDVLDISDATFVKLVRNNLKFLLQNQELIGPFQREIVKTANGQHFYFECNIFLDRLNSFYGDGLRYYLLEKNTPEAQILGNALLCLLYWLKQDDYLLMQHAAQIENLKIDTHMLPYICAYYFTARLLVAEVKKQNNEDLLKEILTFYSNLDAHKCQQHSCTSFEAVIINALLLTGQYESALPFVNHWLAAKRSGNRLGTDLQFADNMKLYRSMIFMEMGSINNAREIFDQINPSTFCFLSKQYHYILYLNLAARLKKSKWSHMQADHLINETGFTRLRIQYDVIEINEDVKNKICEQK